MLQISEHEIDGLEPTELFAYVKKRMAESDETEIVMHPQAYAHIRLLDRHPEVEFIRQASVLRTGLFAILCGFRLHIETTDSEWADYPCMGTPEIPEDPFDRRVWRAMKDIMDEVTAVFGDRCNVFGESVTELHEWVTTREAKIEASPGRYWVMVNCETGVGKVMDTAYPLGDTEMVITDGRCS